jgi:selenide,water dikinase
MVQLNSRAAEISLQFRVHTMTDITGFGLLGHASEVAKASHLTIHIDHSKLPLLPGTLDYSRAGFCAGGLTSNEQFFGPHASISPEISPELRNVLFDPQTSGGLLVFCHQLDAAILLRKLQESHIPAVEIGYTTQQSVHLLTVS